MVKKSLEEATALLTTVNRLIGLRIFEYPRGRPRVLFSVLYILTIYLILVGSSQFVTWYEMNKQMYTLERLLYEFMGYAQCIINVILVFLGLYHSKKFSSYIKKAEEIDENFRIIGASLDYNGLYQRMFLILAAWFLYIGIMSAFYATWLMHSMNLAESLYVVLTFSYVSSVTSIVFINYGMSMRWLVLALRKVNDLLCKLCSTQRTNNLHFGVEKSTIISYEAMMPRCMRPDFPVFIDTWKQSYREFFQPRVSLQYVRAELDESRIRARRRMFKSLRQIHLKLCKTSKILPAMYGSQIALQVRMGVMFVTVSLYYVYAEYSKSTDYLSNPIQLSTICLMEAVGQFIKIASLCRICEYASRELTKTLEMIHLCNKPDDDLETKQEIRQFILQIAQSDFGISGKIRLNYSFLRECISSVTTYLVIMIQMSNSLESMNDNTNIANSTVTANSLL